MAEPTVDRVAALERDLAAIPDVLDAMAGAAVLGEAGAAFVDRLRAGGTRRLVITGLGSSRFAALHVEDGLRAAGYEVVVVPASSDALPEPAADLACIAISNSGRTSETVAAALHYRGRTPVLAVTRDAMSPLAAAADGVATLPVAAEESGIATTSWAATVAVLLHLAAAFGARPPAEATLGAAAAATRSILDTSAAWLPDARDAVGHSEQVTVLAPWADRGVAEQVALLFREGPRRSAEAYETAEWLHVGVYTALPGSFAVLLTGSPADAEVVRTIEGRSGRVLIIDPDGRPSAALRDIPTTNLDGDARRIVRLIAPALLGVRLWRDLTGG